MRDNRKPASLSDLKAGQRVVVVQAPKRTLVTRPHAEDALTGAAELSSVARASVAG